MASTALLSALRFLLLLFLLPVSSLAELWNINCGASEGHVASNDLHWVGDSGYVHSGESHKVENSGWMFTRLQTLRSFPRGKKNCYSIPVGEGTKIHARVEYAYYDYDGLENPPEFTVLCEDILYGNARTNMDMDKYWYMDFSYVTRHSNASICFGRKNDAHDPIINALQAVALDPGMYPLVNSSVVLQGNRKVAFGASSKIGYPDDPFDRRWRPSDDRREGFNYTMLASNGTVVDTNSAIDKPPLKMFTMAASPPEGENNLTIRVSNYVSAGAHFYFNMYFSEVSDLAAGSQEKRSFHIYLNDKLLTDPIVPPFNDVLDISNVTVAPADAKFILVPTADSTLLPIISGFEILVIDSDMIGSGTYSSDVEALSILQDTFAVLKSWSGDPCLPVGYNWEWVNCSNHEPPRVTDLHLSGYGLEGSLPDFGGLEALRVIDLHNNNLSGSVPEFLAELPNLRELNLANNDFSDYPPSLKGIINVTGNPKLDTAMPSPPSQRSPPDTALPPAKKDGCEKISSSSSIFYLLMVFVLVSLI